MAVRYDYAIRRDYEVSWEDAHRFAQSLLGKPMLPDDPDRIVGPICTEVELIDTRPGGRAILAARYKV